METIELGRASTLCLNLEEGIAAGLIVRVDNYVVERAALRGR